MEHYYILSILSFVISMVSGFAFIPAILNYCKRKNLYDIPTVRKVHKNLIPRLGGICFFPSMFIAFALTMYYWYLSLGHVVSISMWSVFFFIGLLIIYVTGIIDDIAGLTPNTKLVMQILAACALPLSGLYINNFYGFLGVHSIGSWLGMPLTVFAIVYIMNAINLIDGIDGLSGSLAFIMLGGFAYFFACQGLWIYVVLITGLMGVLVSFLYFNLFGNPDKNRKIFMGDSGSLSLGYVVAFLFVKFAMNNQDVMPFREDGLLMPYSLLIVPAYDVIRVSLVRLMAGQPIFSADKNHIHHKLMRVGMSQRYALVVILFLALGFIFMNKGLSKFMPMTVIVIIDITVWILFHIVVNVLTPEKE